MLQKASGVSVRAEGRQERLDCEGGPARQAGRRVSLNQGVPWYLALAREFRVSSSFSLSVVCCWLSWSVPLYMSTLYVRISCAAAPQGILAKETVCI
eukprot:scaffold4707_cov117-Isochrysis_galbana.AAC.2